MKKIGMVLVGAAVCGCLLTGCTTTPSPEERVIPEVAYTVNEALAGTVDANAEQFYSKNVQRVESPLKDKVIYWLGSSVTYGQNAGGESMAEFLAAKTGCICKKDAVSGTTIFDDNKTENTGVKSYTRRLMNSTVFDKTEKVDAFICQISTNDAWGDRKQNWGEIAPDDKLYLEDFDVKTTMGGIESIIAYVTDTWQCPIYFYSGAYFGDKKGESPRENGNPSGTDYGELIGKVKEIAAKWKKADVDVQVIDLFNDTAFNAAVSDAYYSWATHDPIHPYRAGYLTWWMPYFEQFLLVALDLY